MPEIVLTLHKVHELAVQPAASDEVILSIARFVKGDPGASTGSATQNVFISATAPVNHPVPYLWLQTGMGSSGTDMTLWVEDGQV